MEPALKSVAITSARPLDSVFYSIDERFWPDVLVRSMDASGL